MRFIAPSLLVALFLSVPAGAQTFSTVRLDGMPTLWVTERNGQETKGKLLKWTDDAIVVQTDTGERTFGVSDVALVERRGDSLKNGAIIGGVVGVVAGAFAGALTYCEDGCPATRIAGGLTAVGIYAAIGAAIDAAIPGRRRLWPASPANGNITLNIDAGRRRAFVGWRVIRK
jgi:hypothetical protein